MFRVTAFLSVSAYSTTQSFSTQSSFTYQNVNGDKHFQSTQRETEKKDGKVTYSHNLTNNDGDVHESENHPTIEKQDDYT